MGLPPSIPPRILVQTNGNFYAKGRLYRITPSEAMPVVQYFIISPLSQASYSDSELDALPRYTSLASPLSKEILVPRQSAVYASILRSMLTYPRYCATRGTLQSDLSQLIGYNLYDLQDGYVDADDEELWEALGFDRRVGAAYYIVRGWGVDGQWREDEQWIGDALGAVVRGEGDIEHLPWSI